MRLHTQTPKKALKAFLKQKPLRSEIDAFKTNLILLLDKISVIENRPTDESEEHLKNDLRDFLRDTYYRDTNAINTKDKKDLVIHLGKSTNSEVGVIIEAKRPGNINEMVSADNPNKKALHELILYYLDERFKAGNNQLKQLVITNVNEWYIIDANYFDKHIYRNTQIKRLYDTKLNDKKDNPFFYEEIAKIIAAIDADIPCVYFDIRNYNTILRNHTKEDDRELIALYKILSPQHLLKIATPNDSNSLNEKFYKELLHLIGLEEAKENGKNIIRRKIDNRNAASLIEATIEALQTEDVLHRLPDQSVYGENKEERIFNVALELCITWINRILFLKLLEGQLIVAPSPAFPKGEGAEYRFLNTETINDFDELFKLFHKVLAVNINDRSEAIKNKYSRVPYLNSSLFEISKLEDQTIKINSLDNNGIMPLMKGTILSDKVGMGLLNYLFRFLDAYDFASEGTEDVQEDNKTIINASVLGKVFEKINGYKDGSIFTPGFITMYMCRQSIRLAVVEKFNEYCANHHLPGNKINTIEDAYELIGAKKMSREQANGIINSLKICDPAVGSGHFLVSALKEMIAIKSGLGVLMDEYGKTLRDYEIEIINDELIITDENGNPFAYNPKNKESARVQKTLFHEKQTIIENCLFGVDINPNSVKICRLRLWIELLKNAYYKAPSPLERAGREAGQLETLPNIDINIKCGNSLLSRFAIDADLSKALKSIKYDVEAYRGFVKEYKNEKNREVKRGLEKIIDSIKGDFRTHIGRNNDEQKKLDKLNEELYNKYVANKLFSQKLTPSQQKDKELLKRKVETQQKKIDDIKDSVIYKNAFEWRFEFPEVLNNNGEFEGFDVVIGNPPYIRAQGLGKNIKQFYSTNFKTAIKQYDILVLFFEKSLQLVKNNAPISFIVSNKFLIADYGEKLRQLLIQETAILEAIDISYDDVFKEASVYPYIITLRKENNSEIRLGNSIRFKPNFYDENIVVIPQSKYIDNLIFDFTSFSYSWMNKIELESTLLGSLIKITRGFRPPKNELKNQGKGEKYLIGSDIKGAYSIQWSGNTVLYDEKQIEESKSLQIFKHPKIIFRDIGLKFNANYDNEGFLCLKTIYFGYLCRSDYDLKFITAILNSRLINEYFSNKYSIAHIAGGYLRFRKQFVENIPIKNILPSAQAPFITLVNKILSAKQKGLDTAALEKQIDELVYRLYNITPEEQKIIEGK